MAHTGKNVHPAAATTPLRADAAPSQYAGSGCGPFCTTSPPSGDRNVPVDVPHAESSPRQSSAAVYPSSCAVKASPSASLSPVPEQTPHAAEPADMPTLLIICLSPELLSSPSHDGQRGQRLQQQPQSAKHLQQSRAQRQEKQLVSQTTMGDALQAEPEEQRATPTQTPVSTRSCVCLPPDSPGYIFLAEQFLPSLGLPMSCGGGDTIRQAGTTDVFVDACAQQPGLSSEGLADHQHRQVPQQQHKHHQHELRRNAPRTCEDLPQPRLHELPAACLLQTKYYEAPLRLLYQFFEPPTFDREICTPNASSSAAGGELSQTKIDTLLRLTAPPEAVLLLCRSLADLYRAHELLGTPAQQRDFFSSGSAGCSMHEAAATAEVAAANGDTLPLPRLLRHPPYILAGGDPLEADGRTAAAASEQVTAPAVGVGAGKGGEAHDVTTATNEKREGPPTFPGRTQGVVDTVEEGEATGENWLSSVPVKLLVCFDAEEEDTDVTRERERGATRSSYSGPQPDTSYEDCEDPSVILFFENSCFLEKVSLSLPTRCQRDSAAAASDAGAASCVALEASRDARTAGGAPAADETAPAATSRESEAAAKIGRPREAPARCSVRPLLGATMPLLRGTGMGSGSVPALQRLVEALHCHVWPNMRLLPTSNKGSKTGKTLAPTVRQQCEKSSTNLHSNRNGSNSGSSTHSNVKKTDSSATAECKDAKATAGPRPIVGKDVVRVGEQENAVPLAGMTTIEAAAAAESEVSTVVAEGHAGTGTTTVVKRDAATARRVAVPATIETTGGEFAPPTGDVVAAASHTTRERTSGNIRGKGRGKTTGEMPLHAWESLARTVREMRLEAHRLPHAERTAKAEALTLQLAEALGLSDDEDDD